MLKKFQLVFCCLILAALSACENQQVETIATEGAKASTEQIITDIYGRTVTLPQKIEKVLCVGNGALRQLVYLQGQDLLVGVEEKDLAYQNDPKRDYAFVLHEQLKNLPIIGMGGGSAYTAYPEEILKVRPDVIFAGYSKEAVEQLAKDTNIPVIAVRYQSINFIDKSFYESLRIMARVLAKEARAEELLSAIDKYKGELQNRTENISNQDKSTVYVGAVTFNGAHGFAGTYSHFGPLTAINALNTADRADKEGYYEADLEQILIWNPDIIFLEPSNMYIAAREYAVRPEYFAELGAVQKEAVYTMPSFNNYSTNITYCLIDAWWAGKVLFPEQFADVELSEKANEILQLFLGKAYFADMERLGLYYGKIEIGKE